MKRPLSYLGRHPRLSAGIAAIFLAAVVTFAVRSASPTQGPVHPSAAAGIALASATTGSASGPHSVFAALTRRERRAVATTTAANTGRSGGHGIAAQPTTSAALSQSLQQATGLTPSQVTSRERLRVGPARAGQVRGRGARAALERYPRAAESPP